jgi:hypothetical protein
MTTVDGVYRARNRAEVLHLRRGYGAFDRGRAIRVRTVGQRTAGEAEDVSPDRPVVHRRQVAAESFDSVADVGGKVGGRAVHQPAAFREIHAY